MLVLQAAERCIWLSSLLRDDGRELLNVVVETEDGASKQECLRDVHQCAGGYILNVEYLNESECNATRDE